MCRQSWVPRLPLLTLTLNSSRGFAHPKFRLQRSMHQRESKTHRAARARHLGSTSYRTHRLHFFRFLGRRTITPVVLVRRVTPRALASTVPTTSPAVTQLTQYGALSRLSGVPKAGLHPPSRTGSE